METLNTTKIPLSKCTPSSVRFGYREYPPSFQVSPGPPCSPCSPGSPTGFSCTYFGFCCVSFFIALKIYSSAGVPVPGCLPPFGFQPRNRNLRLNFRQYTASRHPGTQPPKPPSGDQGKRKGFCNFYVQFFTWEPKAVRSVACGSLRLRGGGCFFPIFWVVRASCWAATDNRGVD